MQFRAVASPEWGPEREQLHAFYLALVQAKMCYGVASWWFDTSLSDRERLERVRAQAAHIVAGIPKAANREDALREARLKSINKVAHRRALEYYLCLKAKGPAHAKVADSIFPPDRPIHVRLAKAQHLPSTIDSPENHTTRRCCSCPGVFTSTSPRRAASRRTHQRRTRRYTLCGVCSGSAILTIRCGRMSMVMDVSSGVGAPVYPKDGRLEVVYFELCRLPAAAARNVWRRRRG
ncbi:hypothetical protein ERJ75_001071700 [Trypanosoma vivax]|nr:hypothetical protein TRVL_09392 [Trypanosoma vivax]KAH8610733.1 hypothetical protein ERJ75_001071700 [Trypanosoma vivax]